MASCKDCADRHIGCHGTCENYLKERAKRDRAIEARHKDKDWYTSAAAQSAKKKIVMGKR